MSLYDIPANTGPPPPDFTTAIANLETQIEGLRREFTILRKDFNGFMDIITEQFDHLYQRLYSVTPLPGGPHHG